MKRFKTLAIISTAAIVASMGLSVMATTTKQVDTTSSAVKVESVQNTTTKTSQDKASKVQAIQDKKITEDKAKNIALTDAKLNSSDVTFERVELEYENNVAVYDIEFYTNSVEYDYEIDALSGAIREAKQEGRKVSTQANTQVSTQSTVNQTSKITAAKAKEIAVSHAGLSGQAVIFEKVELDTDDGVALYEVEFYHNGMEYNYEISATNGKVLEFEVDND